MFWYVTWCSLVDKYQYLGGTYYFHLEGSFTFYILKVEVADSSETSVPVQSNVQDDRKHNIQYCDIITLNISNTHL